jgi:hypothetical protein
MDQGITLQNGITLSTDGVPVTTMTPEQIADLQAQVDAARNLNLPQLHDSNDPHSRLFAMILDGTQNDGVNDPQHATNPFLLRESIRSAYGDGGNVHDYLRFRNSSDHWNKV